MEEQILICACKNPKHMIKISYDKTLGTAYCDIHLNKLSFWKRLNSSLKYVIGKENKFGDFDEFIFDKQHADTLIELGYKLKNTPINFF